MRLSRHLARSLVVLLLAATTASSVFAFKFGADLILDRTDTLVHLSGYQRHQLLGILKQEGWQLGQLSDADRGVKGAPIRQAALQQTRAILTPEQQAIWDATPVTQGGGLSRQATVDLTAALDEALSLSPDQTTKVAQIYEQQRASMATAQRGTAQMATIQHQTTSQLAALLTPEQLATFNLVHGFVSQDMAQRIEIINAVRSSAALPSRVGAIGSAEITTFANVEFINGKFYGGDYTVRVDGSQQAINLTVKAKGNPWTGKLEIASVTDAAGAAVSL